MPGTNSVSHDDLVLCTCGSQEFTPRDVIEAALFRGELNARWKEFLRGVEAERRADELDTELDDSVIADAAEAFRYEQELITAEETEAWLTTRGLTLDDFTDYFTRRCRADAVDEKIVPEQIEYISATSELRSLFVAELILCGELDHMTTRLMFRLAARCDEKDSDPDAIKAEERKFFDRNKIEPAQLPNWLKQLGRDSKWFDEMVAMEAAFRRRCDTVLAPQLRQHELAALRLPLTRFETEMIEVESHDAAQEALFCVREDGMSMKQVAVEGGYPYRRVDFFLGDIPTDSQSRFLSVSPGDVLEPFPHGDGFELYRLIKKIEPQADDPAVEMRIERRLINRHFSELASRYTERRLAALVSAE